MTPSAKGEVGSCPDKGKEGHEEAKRKKGTQLVMTVRSGLSFAIELTRLVWAVASIISRVGAVAVVVPVKVAVSLKMMTAWTQSAREEKVESCVNRTESCEHKHTISLSYTLSLALSPSLSLTRSQQKHRKKRIRPWRRLPPQS